MNNQLAKIQTSIAKKYKLEPWHIELLRIVMLPKAFRPHRKAIEARFGISEPTYYHWLRHPRFNLARRDFVKQYYKDDIPDVLMAIKDEAISGNPVAAKLFLEYVDDFNKDSKNGVDETPPPIPKGEVKIIIQQLTQKFYGNKKSTVRNSKDETQYELRGSVIPDEEMADSLSGEVDKDFGDQASQSGNGSDEWNEDPGVR